MPIFSSVATMGLVTIFLSLTSSGYASDPASFLSQAVVDSSNYVVKEGSYTAPNGLVWGPVVRGRHHQIFKMNFYQAVEHCKSMGQRLPTRGEAERLKIYLGYSNGRYQPGLVPDLHGNTFWLGEFSFLFMAYSRAYYFIGSTGEISTMGSPWTQFS